MRIYGVGTAKSGTHSIVGLFEGNYRASHEVDHVNLIEMILKRTSGEMSQSRLLNRLSERDRRLGLEVDSSQLNGFVLQELMMLYPEARFVLTIRDCFSWLRSYLDHQLCFPVSPEWLNLRHLRFGPSRFTYSRHERALEQNGLYSIHSYFRYWNRHNDAVLNSVPVDKLLIVPTGEISDRIDEIAEFAGVPAPTLDPTKAHLFRALRRSGVLAQIDKRFLEDQMLAHCGALMARWFPATGPEEALI